MRNAGGGPYDETSSLGSLTKVHRFDQAGAPLKTAAQTNDLVEPAGVLKSRLFTYGQEGGRRGGRTFQQGSRPRGGRRLEFRSGFWIRQQTPRIPRQSPATPGPRNPGEDLAGRLSDQ